MFGAAAGSWLYDSFRGGRGSLGGRRDHVRRLGLVAGNSGAGDFSGDPGGGGDFGGDAGGGGNFGGGGGGDFGGGGGDFGGGGGGDFWHAYYFLVPMLRVGTH